MIEKADFPSFSPLQVELCDGGMWKLLRPIVFRSKAFQQTFYVPMGFLTDFASVPRLPLAYLLTANRCFKAAAVHDFALTLLPRAQAAALFLEAMEAEGIPEPVRGMMYAAVKLHDISYLEGPTFVAGPVD